jgi:hypothetical protein
MSDEAQILIAALAAGHAQGIASAMSVYAPPPRVGGAAEWKSASQAAVEAAGHAVDLRWSEVLSAALATRAFVRAGEWTKAYAAHTEVFSAFMGVWKEADDEAVPMLVRAMATLTKENRRLARTADTMTSEHGRRPKLVEQEKSFRRLREALRTCNRSGPRQQSFLAACVQYLKVAFAMQNVKSITTVWKMVENVVNSLSKKGGLHWFPRSQVVAYHYYYGRSLMLDDSYALADAEFTKAMALCHNDAWTNKRLIMDYHLPVKMITGQFVNLSELRRMDVGAAEQGRVVAAAADGDGGQPAAKRAKRDPGACSVALDGSGRDGGRTVACRALSAASGEPVALEEGVAVEPRGMLEHRYYRLLRAARRGDMRAYLAQIAEHKEHFIQRGSYLVLESIQHIVFRNLLHRMCVKSASPLRAALLPFFRSAWTLFLARPGRVGCDGAEAAASAAPPLYRPSPTPLTPNARTHAFSSFFFSCHRTATERQILDEASAA